VLAASADGRWVAMLDRLDHYRGDPALDSPDASFAYQSVALWNLPSSTVALRLTDIEFGFGLALSPDGALVVIGGDFLDVTRTQGSGARSLYDGSIIWQKPPPPLVPMSGGCMRTFAFSPDGTLLASGRNYDLDLFRTDSGAPVDKLVTQVSSPGVAFSPDGLRLASSAPALWRVADRTAVWAPPTSDPFATYDPDCFSDNWATLSHDGTLLLTQFAHFSADLSWETTTTLWDATSGATLRSLDAGLPRRPIFSPDGRWILAGDRLLDVKSGEESPLGVPAALSLFLPDGRIVVAAASGDVSLLCPLPPQ
jgi:WD40 repeat protein